MMAAKNRVSALSPQPGPPTADSPPITVAIVEDDEWFSKALAKHLDRAPGFRCLGRYGTGEEALERLPDDPPDVVLMDINLPGLSGIECVRQLKPRLRRSQILMLTVYEESGRIFDALQAGASGYLLKRTSQADLLEAIAEVHEGGSPMTGSIARKVVQFFSRQADTTSETEQLSPREKEILILLSRGMAYKEISEQLSLSIHTVRMHIHGIYGKLQVHSRGEAVARYLKPGGSFSAARAGSPVSDILKKPKLRILVVDADFLARTGLASLLNAEPDLRVAAEANSGREALNLYREHLPDVVLLAGWMPGGMSGEETLMALRREFPEARVLIISVDAGEEYVFRVMQAGAAGYLPKATQTGELLAALKTVHAGKQYLPAVLAARLAKHGPRAVLSSREMEVLELVSKGLTNQEIAAVLGFKESTAKFHVENMIQKLGVTNRTEACREAIELGILHIEV
jgi:DNA-binding NarL/FixJ family response regulator